MAAATGIILNWAETPMK